MLLTCIIGPTEMYYFGEKIILFVAQILIGASAKKAEDPKGTYFKTDKSMKNLKRYGKDHKTMTRRTSLQNTA